MFDLTALKGRVEAQNLSAFFTMTELHDPKYPSHSQRNVPSLTPAQAYARATPDAIAVSINDLVDSARVSSNRVVSVSQLLSTVNTA